jgi:hypothetical protein
MARTHPDSIVFLVVTMRDVAKHFTFGEIFRSLPYTAHDLHGHC